ncbi:hypothetical protein ACA910_021355 [Epithemia clementina (nom. ined.)]
MRRVSQGTGDDKVVHSYGRIDEDNHPHDKDGDDEAQGEKNAMSHGTSTVWSCTVNVTNAIIGAGCIGYGGAMANSGGYIFIVLMTFFAILFKFSFDMLVELVLLPPRRGGVHHKTDSRKLPDPSSAAAATASFENLPILSGYKRIGLWIVMASKGFYSLGCMVAYVVIIKNNLASGCKGLIPSSWLHWFGLSSSSVDSTVSTPTQSFLVLNMLNNADGEMLATMLVCLTVMLPLCLLRDVSLLARFSSAKIALYCIMLAIVMYLFITLPQPASQQAELSFYDKWWDVKIPDIFQNMGTIVLSFATAHNIHILFRSLQPQHCNMRDWRRITTMSMTFSYFLFLGLALFAYMTYWDQTSSDLFLQYPQNIPVVSVARVLLSISMLFTYPMAMFALREIVTLCLDAMVKRPKKRRSIKGAGDCSVPTSAMAPLEGEEQDSLIITVANAPETLDRKGAADPATTSTSLLQHVVVTVTLWAASMILAMNGASLGQVLNLIGCASGTLISFILPAIFSFRLQGVTFWGTIFMFAGCFVGIVGTWFSIKDLATVS